MKKPFRDYIVWTLKAVALLALPAALALATSSWFGWSGVGAVLGGLAIYLALTLALLLMVSRATPEDATSTLPLPWRFLAANPTPRLPKEERIKQPDPASQALPALQALPEPVILLNQRREVVLCNRAAAKFLGVEIQGKDLSMALRHPDVLATVDLVLAGQRLEAGCQFTVSGTPQRRWVARASGLAKGKMAVLYMQDATAVERAETMRADFIANASHELRTPLAALIGFIETLQGPARDDAVARERFLVLMRDQARRMARLVQDLLSLSRIELNEHSAPQGHIDLVQLVERAVELGAIPAAERDMTVAVVTTLVEADVQGDEDELEQVLLNLIDNAVAYGRAGTPITVELAAVATGYAISVVDRGDGIAAEHLPRLTERFYRVPGPNGRQRPGTGLGLAIVKHIVNRHRGQLTISSEVGAGSRFTVTIPASVT